MTSFTSATSAARQQQQQQQQQDQAQWKFVIHKNKKLGILIVCPKCGMWGRLSRHRTKGGTPWYFIYHGNGYMNRSCRISYYSQEFEAVDNAYSEAQNKINEVVRHAWMPDRKLSAKYSIPVEVVERIKSLHRVDHYSNSTSTSAFSEARRSRPWTEEDDRKLIQLYYEGWPLGKIAKELGRSYNAVRYRVAKFKRKGMLLSRSVLR